MPEYKADGWAIAGKYGFIFGTHAMTRKAAINATLVILFDHTWPQLYKGGYRCVRVYRRVK